MGRRYDHSREELRRMILDAAREIALADGPDAITARAVARRVGYTPGTLYSVFRNLDDLVLQVNAETLADLGEWLETPDDMAPVERLHAMADAYLGYIREYQPLWRLLFDYHLTPGAALPDWYMVGIAQVIARLEDALAALLPGATAAARRDEAFALFASIHGICVLLIGRGYRAFQAHDPDPLVHGVIDTAVAGWRARRADPSR